MTNEWSYSTPANRILYLSNNEKCFKLYTSFILWLSIWLNRWNTLISIRFSKINYSALTITMFHICYNITETICPKLSVYIVFSEILHFVMTNNYVLHLFALAIITQLSTSISPDINQTSLKTWQPFIIGYIASLQNYLLISARIRYNRRRRLFKISTFPWLLWCRRRGWTLVD